jgi:hypothetical protein
MPYLNEELESKGVVTGGATSADRRNPRRSFGEIGELLVAGVCVVAFALTALFFVVSQLTGSTAGTRDYVVYWASGQQLAHHANPYDKDAIEKIERAAGLPAGYPALFMRNPPWTLLLTVPLGYLSLRMGALVWSLCLVTCLAVSVRMMWQMLGRPRNSVRLLGYSFAPALICLIVGQTSLFALLGYVLFLRLHRLHPMLAGVTLWLCALKPHLFLPFGITLLAWVAVTKAYRLLLGGLAALATSCLLVFWMDDLAWPQYVQMTRRSGIEAEFIPSLSVVLRLWTYPQAMWLQYLPAAVGCVWALLYFWPRRSRWDWMKNGSPLLLVSVLTAPYSWLMDQAVIIPAVLNGAHVTRSRTVTLILLLASATLEGEFLSGILIPSPLYLWTAPVWLAWYLLANRSATNGQSEGRESPI